MVKLACIFLTTEVQLLLLCLLMVLDMKLFLPPFQLATTKSPSFACCKAETKRCCSHLPLWFTYTMICTHLLGSEYYHSTFLGKGEGVAFQVNAS